MKHFFLKGTLPLMALVSMTACIDDKYDLSDIDTTTEIKVKDLTLPFNLDEIKLKDIISVDEDSEFNTITIGDQKVYAVNKKGSFTSDAIEIPGFSAPAPEIDGIQVGFSLGSGSRASRDNSYEFSMTQSDRTAIEYVAAGIDPAIISVEALGTEGFEIVVNFDASSVANVATLELSDMELSFPKGLDIQSSVPADITCANGILNIPSLQLDANGKGSIRLNVAGISDMVRNGYAIVDHSLSINEEVSIIKGTLIATLKNGISNIISDIVLDVDFNFSELVAKTFSGEVQYSVDGISIDPVEINDLPDFLQGEETNIVLANPQIYLNLNNPVGEYDLSYRSGLNIIPVRNGVAEAALSLDNGYFQVDNRDNVTNLYLSPYTVTSFPDNFVSPSPQHVPFTSLSDAIAGNGIPQQLKIELVNPEIPVQHVSDFRLGERLDGVEGNWEFLAPLAFKPGSASKIFYTADGWNDEDVDAITITHLTISMGVSNTLPVGLTLSGYPIDADGKMIPGTKIEPENIVAGAVNQEVELKVTGTITHLDGFTFEIGIGSGSDQALSPDQTITLNNIRAKVSGSYIKEL